MIWVFLPFIWWHDLLFWNIKNIVKLFWDLFILTNYNIECIQISNTESLSHLQQVIPSLFFIILSLAFIKLLWRACFRFCICQVFFLDFEDQEVFECLILTKSERLCSCEQSILSTFEQEVSSWKNVFFKSSHFKFKLYL